MNTETIDLDAIKIGDEVNLHYADCPGAAQGGVVTRILFNPWVIELRCGTAGYIREFRRHEIDHATIEVPLDASECLNYGPDCRGQVDYRWSGGTRHWPRCEFHIEQRLKAREDSSERYADSDCVPDWFDPADAGERWEDDY